MNVRHYYNEFDPDMAAWLRVLIAEKLIPAGDVDERSIVDVKATELRGYVQHHFFAGISGWPYALRLAGWPEDRPVATCSCPCPPFSAAGKKKACPQCAGTNPMPHVGRTGYFVCCLCGHEWFADERHLWPEAWRIFRELRPVAIYGEQVASGDGRVWLAGVRASLQILGYDFGGADLCSSSIGAPNIRQRLFWLAESEYAERRRPISLARQDGRDRQDDGRQETHREPGTCGEVQRLAEQSNEHNRRFGNGDAAGRGRLANGCWMGEPIQQGLEGHAGHGDDGSESGWVGETAPRPTAETGDLGGVGESQSNEHDRRFGNGRGRLANGCWMGEPNSQGLSERERNGAIQPETMGPCSRQTIECGGDVGRVDNATSPRLTSEGQRSDVRSEHGHTTEPAGFWADSIWHLCRDGKQRRIPFEPVLQRMVARVPKGMDLCGAENGFPLAQKIPKIPKRVMLLKGYGNSINPRIASEFINATK